MVAAKWSRAHSPGLEVSFSADRRCRFLDTVPLVPVLRNSSACKTMFRCRFLAIVDVRTIYRYHAKIAQLAGHAYASPVMIKWCLNEQVELLCKLAMLRLSSGV